MTVIRFLDHCQEGIVGETLLRVGEAARGMSVNSKLMRHGWIIGTSVRAARGHEPLDPPMAEKTIEKQEQGRDYR
jgi:hypothetical protein